MDLPHSPESRSRVEEFQRRHRVALLSLLFTDIVGSTGIKQRLGDTQAVMLIQYHHAGLRALLRQFPEGEEIETAGDSFFLIFNLSCQTPEMVEREMRMHLLVHNMVRRMALEAARRHDCAMERMSFAGTLSVVHAYGEALLRTRSQGKRRQLEEQMYRMIAEDLVPLRPGRREPRAVKRRPKGYPLLTCHRSQYREILHRNKYRR